MRVTIKKKKTLHQEEQDDSWDKVYGYEDLRRLQRGVVEALIQDGTLQEVEVDCDDEDLYLRAKKINNLDNEINKRLKIIRKLDKAIAHRRCNKPPTQDEMWDYCRDLIQVSKGKDPSEKNKK